MKKPTKNLQTRKHTKLVFTALFTLGIAGILSIALIYFHIDNSSKNFIFQNTESTHQHFQENNIKAQAGLVLGAKVYRNGTMSDVLMDRVLTALEFYKKGFFDKFLVSGDHGRVEYDEVNTIKDFLLSRGISPEDIFLDHAGFDTYDSVYRAKHIFQAESVMIFSQGFHLPRAVYIARNQDLESYGIISDKHVYLGSWYNNLRETGARVKAFFDLAFGSHPKFLGKKIPITGNSMKSWDIPKN